MIPWGPFEPDRFQEGTPVSAIANGVLPVRDGYGPWPSLTQISVALGATCKGAISVVDSSGVSVLFAFTATAAFRYVGLTDNWLDVTRLSGGAYTCPSDYLWSLAQYGTYLIACQQGDVPQVIDIDSGTNFAALGGSPPTAGVVQVVGDFVFLANLVDYPDRIVWSGRNNPTFWTYGQQDSDFQIFPDGGLIRGVTPLQGGLIFQDNAIRAFRQTGDRAIFSFQLISDRVGLLADSSLVTIGGVSYFYSQSGFHAATAAGEMRRIGTDRIDKWFLDNTNPNRRFAIRGSRDPNRNRVFWLAPSSANTSELLDLAVCYDADLDRWSYYDGITASVLVSATMPGWTTDTIDTLLTALGTDSEDASFSLDQRWLAGGAPYLAAFDDDQKLGLISGAPVAATIESMDFQPIANKRSVINELWPQDDANAGTMTLGKKEIVQGSISFGSAANVNARGKVSLRSSGRWHRARRSIPAGTNWNQAVGFTAGVVEDGMR